MTFNPFTGTFDFTGKSQSIILNVRDYGAKGDGITDDTAALVSAVSALATAITTYGSAALAFPNGTYQTDGLVVSGLANFQLLGLGGKIRLNRARVGAPLVNTFNVLTLISCTDFSVDGLDIDGNRHTNVTWPTTDRAPVTQYIQSNASSGQANVVVADGTKFVIGQRVWVCGGLTANGGADHDLVDNNSQQGLTIDGISGNTLTLHTNLTHTYTATGTAGGAYVTTYQTGFQNTVGSFTLGNEDQQNGLHLLSCSRFIIVRNSIHDVWESPIKCGIGFDTNANNLASACQYGIITDNRCQRGYDQGISCWSSAYLGVFNNNCNDCGWGGCVFTNTDDSIASDNILRDNQYRIPGDNSSGYGFVIEGGTRNQASGNQILGNYNAGVLLRISPLTFGVGGTTLNGNVSWGSTSFTVASASGFIIGATYMINDASKSESFKIINIVSNTLTIAEKTRFYHPSGKNVGQRIAEDNTIENNLISEAVAGHGIWSSPAVRSIIRNNSVIRNANKGILVEQSNGFATGGTILDGNYLTGNAQTNGNQGILVDTVDDIQIINNRISGNFGDKGIQMKGSRNSRVVGNSISDIQSQGIYFESGGGVVCSHIIVSNNDIKQCDGAGIQTDKVNHFTIMGNNCWANAGDGGISLGGTTFSTIKGNILTANNSNGMLLKNSSSTESTNNLIEGNVVRDDGSGVKGSDGSSLTQGTSIAEQNSANNNLFTENIVDVAIVLTGVASLVKPIKLPINSQSSAYGATINDSVILVTGNTTITLPTAVANQGIEITIKKTDTTNTTTIATTSSQTIDGASTLLFTTKNEAVTVRSDGSNWQVVGQVATSIL